MTALHILLLYLRYALEYGTIRGTANELTLSISQFYHATFDIFRECQTHFKALGEGSVDDKKKSRYKGKMIILR
jgi:hypothetical protein